MRQTSRPTLVIFGRVDVETLVLIRMPGLDPYKVGHVGRDLTLHEDGVAANGVFFVDVDIVVLGDHCG